MHSRFDTSNAKDLQIVSPVYEKLDDFFMDTVVSGMFGHDIHEISKLHMQSRDPTDPKAADVSIWVKEKGFINLSDFATLHLFYESALLALCGL